MKIIIYLSILLLPFKVMAFEKSDCSLKCKGRFYSQKGFKILQDILGGKKKINQNITESFVKGDDGDKSLTMGCLTVCKAKDIRDVLCFILSRDNDKQFMKKLSKIIRANKNLEDFSLNHEKACQKIFPKKADAVSKNYQEIRAYLEPKSPAQGN